MNPTAIRIDRRTLIDVTNPDPRLIDVRDIARVLSRLSRFNGHGVSGRVISVCEHSVNVSNRIREVVRHMDMPREMKIRKRLAGLFHDGHEYIIGDIATPVKEALGREALNAVARPIDAAICMAIGLDTTELHDEFVKNADRYMLEYESAYLFDKYESKAVLRGLADMRRFVVKEGFFSRKAKIGLSASEAELTFMDTYEELCEELLNV